MNENVVEINNLCKTYKDTKAVAHVNMTIKKGDIYGFIGRNGAGKSTTLKMIVGLIFLIFCQIKLFGESRNKFNDRRIGSLSENPGLYPNLSAYDNMELKAIALGLKDKEKIIELLNLVKLDYKSKKIVKKFSLGMKQRLAIALALLGNPDLLILDEPINGLDPEGIRQIREVIQYLNENKKMTIIISSHILGEISAKELDQKCRDYLLLKVEQVEKAIPLLENDLGIYDYIVHENNEIRIYDNIESSKINLVLTKHNIKINQIYYQKQDLESYFLEKIGG